MVRNCDEDSGRSSCSAGSFQVNPIVEAKEDVVLTNVKLRSSSKTQEPCTNTDLKVSIRPRSCTSIFKSPDKCDPFPSCRSTKKQRHAVFSVFDTPRMGGLTDARSTFDIVSSTQLEEPVPLHNNAMSLTTIKIIDENKVLNKQINSNFKRGKPVQRAASRLYRADAPHKGGQKGCVGPEFIVRASQAVKHINLIQPITVDKRIVKVVLLNGQVVEVLCDPNSITAGDIFEAIVSSEKYEHDFMLGIAVLISGDFIFLPDKYKIKKIAPAKWLKNVKKVKVEENDTVTMFLRIKFFLPTNTARNIQGGEWRYRVYLQLRRATVEGQLVSSIQHLVLLAGYALHVEFGEFSFREHGSSDYFLLEHYLPEGSITDNMADIKLRMKRAHESRRGLDRDKAIINYITLAQTFRDYGAHFYSAVWATRDGYFRDVWLSIGPRGVTLYTRNSIVSPLKNSDSIPSRIVLQSLPWHHIHTFYYNKKSLYIIPNGHSGLSKMGIKYKLKMNDNKSCFTFWLASLHHSIYLRLYAKEDFINYLSDELSRPVTETSPPKVDCSNYQDSYNLAVRNPLKLKKPPKRKFKVQIFDKKSNLQNKENKKPSTEELLRQILSPQSDSSMNVSTFSNEHGNSSNDGLSSSESCSLPRRHGVKMGTRVFNGMKSNFPRSPISTEMISTTKSIADLTTTHSDSDDLCSTSGKLLQHCTINSMKLLPERQYVQNTSQSPTAFVIESPKIYQDAFAYNLTSNESCLNASLYEKLNNMGCVQAERIFVTAALERDAMNALGLQVAEGSDGNVYIKSITTGGPAALSNKLLPGDQIISVNGQTLLNIKYEKALSMLQSAPHKVELIVLQNSNKDKGEGLKSTDKRNKSFYDSLANSLDDLEITDDELLNEEALKTIYALIKLTKEKVINHMKEKGSLNTPNRRYLHKCLSENRVYDESDVGNYSSQENTPEKTDNQKFNTWRGHTKLKMKRRPLSLSIPTHVNLPDDFLNSEVSEEVFNKTSLKSIQSSLNSLDKAGEVPRNVALPRNFGLSRKWLGPVRYPVTPCKNTEGAPVADVVKRHFVYGAGDGNSGDQIFL